jgi:hypothetical protein
MMKRDLASVIRAFDAACSRQDLDTATDLFADDAVVQVTPPLPPPDGSLHTGKEQIRDWLRQLLAEHCWVESRLHHVVLGSEVVWLTRLSAAPFRRLGVNPVECTGEAVVEGGKIRSLTLTLSPMSVELLFQEQLA